MTPAYFATTWLSFTQLSFTYARLYQENYFFLPDQNNSI